MSAAPGLAVQDRCPRCGERFHCGAADAAPCPCATLVLDAVLQQHLRERYAGCLCLGCLRQMQADAAWAGPAPSGAVS